MGRRSHFNRLRPYAHRHREVYACGTGGKRSRRGTHTQEQSVRPMTIGSRDTVDTRQLGSELLPHNFSVVMRLHIDEEHVAQPQRA
jgi:hypothetical protein